MEKVLSRRHPGAWAAAGLAAGLLAALALPGQITPRVATRVSAWWGVRLIVSARGDYTIRGGPALLSGEYACRVLWEGRLEPDDDDFLMVHVKTQVLEWRLKERSGPDGREGTLEAPPGMKPDLRMYYVLKDGSDVEFAFELAGVSIPLHASPLVVALDLPRTSARAPARPGRAGGYAVLRGSSRVAIPETDLLGPAPERRFAWDWRRERPIVRKGQTLTVVQAYAAEAVVTVTIH